MKVAASGRAPKPHIPQQQEHRTAANFMPLSLHSGDQQGTQSVAGLFVRFVCPLPSAPMM
jgi:hypothetical protein